MDEKVNCIVCPILSHERTISVARSSKEDLLQVRMYIDGQTAIYLSKDNAIALAHILLSTAEFGEEKTMLHTQHPQHTYKDCPACEEVRRRNAANATALADAKELEDY